MSDLGLSIMVCKAMIQPVSQIPGYRSMCSIHAEQIQWQGYRCIIPSVTKAGRRAPSFNAADYFTVEFTFNKNQVKNHVIRD